MGWKRVATHMYAPSAHKPSFRYSSTIPSSTADTRQQQKSWASPPPPPPSLKTQLESMVFLSFVERHVWFFLGNRQREQAGKSQPLRLLIHRRATIRILSYRLFVLSSRSVGALTPFRFLPFSILEISYTHTHTRTYTYDSPNLCDEPFLLHALTLLYWLFGFTSRYRASTKFRNDLTRPWRDSDVKI